MGKVGMCTRNLNGTACLLWQTQQCTETTTIQRTDAADQSFLQAPAGLLTLRAHSFRHKKSHTMKWQICFCFKTIAADQLVQTTVSSHSSMSRFTLSGWSWWT